MTLLSTRGSRVVTYRVGHMCCGVGAGAKGFNDANPRVCGVQARFECAGGIDVDAPGLKVFEQLTGAKGTHLDLFSRDQYLAFHGKLPPADWNYGRGEATPDDIRRAYGGNRRLDILFASMPCKGFSGLLSAKQSGTDKYQALNGLTLRGLWLALEAYKDDPIRIILFENVPRIRTRGRFLLNQIQALLRSYGYVFAESEHDCGEIGGLGQSRKRFLMIARRIESVPNCVYEPERKRLRGVGEIIGRLPLPGDAIAGQLHRVPMLQWRTWVRLAFVPAGRDWRALNDLRIEDGVLADYGIVPDQPLRDNALGVNRWDDTAPLITGARAPGQGRFSVADPRPAEEWNADVLGVRTWDQHTGTVPGRSGPTNGAHSVADPRETGRHHGSHGVRRWDEPSALVSGASRPSNGPHSVADPRPVQANQTYLQYGVRDWSETTGAVTGQAAPGGGANSVADPRLHRVAHSNVYRVVAFDQAGVAVTSSRDGAVADPRPAESDYSSRKYKVTQFGDASRAVIGASTTGDGAYAVADPRGGPDPTKLHGCWRVEDWDSASKAVIGGNKNGAAAVADPRPTHGSGALSVADPRPAAFADGRTHFSAGGHYGVIDWRQPAKTVTGQPCSYDRGYNSVADPRDGHQVKEMPVLPEPGDRLVARIISTDNTWHRPFTTLELAALQSLFDPDEIFGCADGRWFQRGHFDLGDGSDATKREWIGNAVPSDAARGMAETIGETLLLADLGETFRLDSRAIWVKPLAIALSVDPRQDICTKDAQA